MNFVSAHRGPVTWMTQVEEITQQLLADVNVIIAILLILVSETTWRQHHQCRSIISILFTGELISLCFISHSFLFMGK